MLMDAPDRHRRAVPPPPDRLRSPLRGLSCRLLAVVAAVSAAASARSEPNACFPPEALQARPGEQHPVKHNHLSDYSDVKRTLSAFSPVPGALRGAVRRVDLPPGRKLVALTFDLCEQPGEVAGYDGRIIDYLRANGVKATLFAGGKWMASHAERTRQLMADPLFEIANHSYAHRNLRLLTGTALSQEIEAPQRIYEAARDGLVGRQCLPPGRTVAPRLTLFRFPYGACNPEAIRAVNDAGLVAIQWDLSTGDPSPGTSARAIAAAMLHARPGSIVISHANGRGFHTAEALPLAIPKLRAKGYEFVTVSELLAAGRPVVEPICYDSRPGDTDRYDHPLLRPLSRVAKTQATAPDQPTSPSTQPPAAVSPPRARHHTRDWEPSEGQWQMRVLRGY